MNIRRKSLAAAGFLAISAFALTPAVAAADPPSMYDSCTPTQEGQRVLASNGDTLECVEVDTGIGYDWEEPD
ncbi:hypothetical protein [Tsukamurella paurometabola]|uniref:Uncharacterized protein n=1 Tax=Tsukamurella paurometabola TaxID=2061 RepID=A0A3P8MC46_TSUPA|nr:hypothetical protein [Tsukamurella paurometabola]MBS4103124.1 hypothetical protein [Tsukamurella paurometabola]UEA84838.1 hypothetical protein LK411_08475 [Tsukamurella paurometabola]VDR37423.1 Uncharacterised protein [Tsukamurella paurometabola]